MCSGKNYLNQQNINLTSELNIITNSTKDFQNHAQVTISQHITKPASHAERSHEFETQGPKGQSQKQGGRAGEEINITLLLNQL